MKQPSAQKKPKSKLSASDLCLPIYLDQQNVFDMLAVLEDGLVNVTQERCSIGRSDSEANSAKGSFGVRLWNFFSVDAGASHQAEGIDTQQKEITETRTHTTASLFCKLRSRLEQEGLVSVITNPEQLAGLSPGSFVEIQVRLDKNPIVEIFDRLINTMEFANVASASPTPANSPDKKQKQQRQRSQTINPQEATFQQMKNFHEQLTKSDSIEVIGNSVKSPGITAVVSLNRDSFVKSESEFIGNVFSIFGKVANVIPPEDAEKINLLSRTTLSGINPSIIQGAFSKLNEAGNMGLVLPKLMTEVEGPALQIIPIAIFL